MSKKRMFLSFGMLVFVAAVVAGGTGAFFSDTETSSGNVFAAGAIDLQIGNTSYYNGAEAPDMTWQLADLDDGNGPNDGGAYLFFDYEDLKPGDWGEDTIELVVENNPAYACMDITLEGTDDNGITEPEGKAGDSTDGQGEGELQDYVNFIWWIDDGDNVLEDDETSTFGQTTLAGLDGVTVPISDDTADSILDAPLNNDATFPDTETYHIGKAWCYGELTLDLVAAGQGVDPTVDPGVDCDGSAVGNMSQSDIATVGLEFFAVQSRNNDGFSCADRDGGVFAASYTSDEADAVEVIGGANSTYPLGSTASVEDVYGTGAELTLAVAESGDDMVFTGTLPFGVTGSANSAAILIDSDGDGFADFQYEYTNDTVIYKEVQGGSWTVVGTEPTGYSASMNGTSDVFTVTVPKTDLSSPFRVGLNATNNGVAGSGPLSGTNVGMSVPTGDLFNGGASNWTTSTNYQEVTW